MLGLIDALQDVGNELVRANAAYTLGQMDIYIFKNCFTYVYYFVRASFKWAPTCFRRLGEMGAVAIHAVPALRKAVGSDPNGFRAIWDRHICFRRSNGAVNTT